jgi:hypothetical protein
MLKFATDLSDDNEYAIVWWGQSIARPWGTLAEGYAAAPQLDLDDVGIDLTGIVIVTGSGTETLFVAGGTITPKWHNATLRLGSVTQPLAGYALVLNSGPGFLNVTWIVPATPGTVAGYLVREEMTYGSYPQVRVLTPYQPYVDTALSTRNVPYPDPAATWANGGRRLLAPGFTTPSTVTTFEDLAAFLPLTFLEGVNSWGISESNDASGTGPHPAVSATGASFTFSNTGTAPLANYFTDGYLRVEWDLAGVPKLSWARIASNTTTVFTLTTAGWLGDGSPAAGTLRRYEAWVPHWNNSPHAYLPGDGFTYVNNDMQPYWNTLQAGTSAGTATSSSSTTLVNTGATWVPNQWLGWTVTMGGKTATVLYNTTTTITVASWSGGGSPTPGAYTIAAVNGTNARTLNRPRGRAYPSAVPFFGSMLVFAWRLSAAIGKRVNIIHLGINGASLTPAFTGSQGYQGIVGWWDPRGDFDFNPASPAGLWNRLRRLTETIAPAALVAEGNTKPLKILAIVGQQGESDTLYKEGRESYRTAFGSFYEKLRDVIKTAGLSPYSAEADVPFVHARVAAAPWELTGSAVFGGVPATFTGDGEGLVNNTIVETTVSDGFADFVEVDDVTRGADYIHPNGAGEALLGRRLGDAALSLIDYSLSFGSDALSHPPTDVIALCNKALAHVGETSQITSLADGSVQANLCRDHFPDARDVVLSARKWGLSLRRVVLQEVIRPPTPLYDHFAYCYVVPGDAIDGFSVLPKDPVSDYSRLETGPEAFSLPVPVAGGPAGAAYAIEASPDGHRLLFTNQAEATLRYVWRQPDVSRYPAALRMAMALHLGSIIAPMLIKGDQGEAVSARLVKKMGAYAGLASTNDSNQRMPNIVHIPGHMQGR